MLVVASLVLVVLVLCGSLGIGASSRTIGIHVPYIHRSREAWISGHRAAAFVIIPAGVGAIVFSSSAGLGWSVLVGGLLLGGAAATIAARRVSDGTR